MTAKREMKTVKAWAVFRRNTDKLAKNWFGSIFFYATRQEAIISSCNLPQFKIVRVEIRVLPKPTRKTPAKKGR